MLRRQIRAAGLRPGQFVAAFGGGESIGVNAEMQFGCKHEAAAVLNGKQQSLCPFLRVPDALRGELTANER
jgi:hypothetical protein